MPRPQTKKQLLKAIDETYAALMALIESYGEDARTIVFPDGYLNRGIRDVLAHLYEWQEMFGRWYADGMSGVAPQMPAPGYTRKTVPALNKHIHALYRTHTFDDAYALLMASHQRMTDYVRRHRDEELFTKKYYDWTGSTSLGSYIISATSSHYIRAKKLIKRCVREALTNDDKKS